MNFVLQSKMCKNFFLVYLAREKYNHKKKKRDENNIYKNDK